MHRRTRARVRRSAFRPARRVAVWHGRVEVASKGVDALIDAWQAICASRPGRSSPAHARHRRGRGVDARSPGAGRGARRLVARRVRTGPRAAAPASRRRRRVRVPVAPRKGSPSPRSKRWRAGCPSSPPTRPAFPICLPREKRPAAPWCRVATPWPSRPRSTSAGRPRVDTRHRRAGATARRRGVRAGIRRAAAARSPPSRRTGAAGVGNRAA